MRAFIILGTILVVSGCGKPMPRRVAHLTEVSVDNWSASEDEITAAPCRKAPPTLSTVESYLEEASLVGPRVTETIRGIPLEDESVELANDLYELVTRLDYGNDEVPGQELVTVSGECHKALCAVRELFGADIGPKLLYLKYRYGFNGSHLAYEDADLYEEGEIDSVLRAIQGFPEDTFPLERNHQLIRYKRGVTLAIYDHPDSETSANATIALFDPWSRYSLPLREYVVTHELGHHIAGHLDLENVWPDDDSTTSTYGETNPSENLAEAVAAYRFNPKRLREASEEKYALLRDVVFGGAEFEDDQGCEGRSGTQPDVARYVDAVLGDWNLEVPLTDDLAQACAEETADLLMMRVAAAERPFQYCATHAFTKSLDREGLVTLDLAPERVALVAAQTELRHRSPLELERFLAARVRGFSREAWQEATDPLTDGMIERIADAILAWDDRRSFSYRGKAGDTDLEPFCEGWSGYGYQALSPLEPAKSLTFYRKESQLNLAMREICLAVHGDVEPGERQPMTREAVRAALEARLSGN